MKIPERWVIRLSLNCVRYVSEIFHPVLDGNSVAT